MLVYKVVCVENDHYQSAHAKDSCALRYEINKVTEPNFGKIFVFKRLRHAVDFVSEYQLRWHLKILICESKNAIPCYTIRTSSDAFCGFELSLRSFWEGSTYLIRNPPIGTYICDSLIPLEEVSISVEDINRWKFRDLNI